MVPATEILAESPEATERAGEELGARLRPGDVVALSGALGAGKTCFIRGLCRGLGVTQTVTSPTFVLVNHYAGRAPVYHVDAYRTESLTELIDLGFDELVSGEGVTIVEWAEKLTPLLPPATIRVHVEGLGDEPRRISVRMPPGVSEGGR